MTRDYQRFILHKTGPINCRRCGTAKETLGHLLSACPPLKWTAYKERHDRVVYQVIRALCRKFQFKIPPELQMRTTGWKGVGVIDMEKLKISVDLSIPTDARISECRPDIVVENKMKKIVRIMEVACTWTSLVVAREKEKREKYETFATDIARQKPGWRITVHPLVVGDLGSLAGFKEELHHTRLFDKKDITKLARDCQADVLAVTAQIHLEASTQQGCGERRVGQVSLTPLEVVHTVWHTQVSPSVWLLSAGRQAIKNVYVITMLIH